MADVPIGQEGKIHVVGRNDMAIPMTLGCTWRVQDPDGVVVEEHTGDWAGIGATDVNPGQTHEFISPGSFDINKPGTWAIGVWLWMNVDSPTLVAEWSGVLCTVAGYKGSIVKKELEYDSTRLTIQ